MKGSGGKGRDPPIHDCTNDAPEGWIATQRLRHYVPADYVLIRRGYTTSGTFVPKAPAAAAATTADDEADQQTDNSASASAPAGAPAVYEPIFPVRAGDQAMSHTEEVPASSSDPPLPAGTSADADAAEGQTYARSVGASERQQVGEKNKEGPRAKAKRTME